MAKFHIAKDGVVRQCRAKTPESCRATSSDDKQHFENKDSAEKAYESRMKEKTVPKASVKRKSDLNRKNIRSNTQEKSVNKKENQSNFNSIVHASIVNQLDTMILISEISDLKNKQPASLREVQDLEISLDERNEVLTQISKNMKSAGSFSTKEIREVDSMIYANKIYSAESRINFFMKNRNKIKKEKFFHTKNQKEEIRKANNEVNNERIRAENNLIKSVEDYPKWMNRDQVETIVAELKTMKKDYSLLYDKVKLPSK